MDFHEYKLSLELSAKEESHALSPYNDFMDFILARVKGRCLDIGCGDGLYTEILKKKSTSLVSIDLSQERIKMAMKAINSSDVNFILTDTRLLPFKPDSFDSICAFEVIEHLPSAEDHMKFLSEVKRVLSCDGVFLISTPNKPLFWIYCLLSGEKHPTHFSELNYFQFKSILKKHFSSVKIRGKFGYLSVFYQFYIARRLHNFLNKLPPLCKGLFGVCKKNGQFP